MRQTTAKILLATYPSSPDVGRLVACSGLATLTPELTDRGFESLIALLKNRQWLLSSVLPDGVYVQLTALGLEAIRAQFPALDIPTNNTATDWYLILFSTAPTGDPSFRYLRRLLLRHAAVQLGRSQYVFSQVIPSEVELVLKRLYGTAVYVCRVSAWMAGFISPRILNQKQVSELITISSGLSKQTDKLLARFYSNKRLTINDKKTINQLYDQLIFILKNHLPNNYADSSLVISPLNLLAKLQQII